MFRRRSFPPNTQPPVIILFKKLVVLFSCVYILCYNLWVHGNTAWSPLSLFNWHELSLRDLLWKPLIASFILPYPSLSWSLINDLFFLSVLFVPIVCFIASYVGRNSFIVMWMMFAYSSAISQACIIQFIPFSAYISDSPYSLFSNISFGMMVFWLLMARTSKQSHSTFLFIPISLEWIGALSLFLCVIMPLTDGAFAHAGASLCTGALAYLYGITQWQLKSHAHILRRGEETIYERYISLHRAWHWYVMRSIRKSIAWLYNLFRHR